MSGDFRKLPPEVRDIIWGLVLEEEIHFRLNEEDRLETDGLHGGLGLFFTDRQVSLEARKIFYSTDDITFTISEENSKQSPVDAAARFFRQISPNDLATVQSVGFMHSDDLLQSWFDDIENMMAALRSDWSFTCDTLAYKRPQLRRLLLFINYRDEDQTFPCASPGSGKASALKDDKSPAWAYLFGNIQGLHHLDVRICYEAWDGSVGILEDAKNHLLCHAVQSRSRMLYDHVSRRQSRVDINEV